MMLCGTQTVGRCLFYNKFCVKSFLNQFHFVPYGVENKRDLIKEKLRRFPLLC